MSQPAATHGFWQRRRSGVLLHPTSLPGATGNGDLGPEARHFADFLAASGFGVWQMLPLGPTHADGSPYQTTSVHAGNPLLIDLGELQALGWLAQPPGEVAGIQRLAVLACAHRGFQRQATPRQREELAEFSETEAGWLDDFALYQALKDEHQGRAWCDWPPALRDRDAQALAHARARLSAQIDHVRFQQWLFFRQWRALREHCAARGLALFGDLPIFVAHDSADVWARRELFLLDAEGRQQVVAGVPPDYFSETGQRWGNPLYDWERMAAEGHAWWVARLRTQMRLFDLLRIDHFRGFAAYWEIPAESETAIAGRWVQGPGAALFEALETALGALPLVAEDLGVITEDVTALRDGLRLPGMKILQFAFDGGPDNPYLPHQHRPLCVVYTGTHDNDTSLGWWQGLDASAQAHVLDYLGHPGEAMPRPLLRAALASVARLAVIPLQDLLELDGDHRMNRPGVAEGNWRWRFEWDMVPAGLGERLLAWNRLYGRH